MQKIEIKIKNISTNALPTYATSGSAAVDLRAFIANDILLKPLQRSLVNTGLFIEIPLGYEAQIRPRSGLAINNGITCLNSPGTIDSDYRGEIKVILINLSNEDFVIKNGDRIAQMVIAKVEQVAFCVTENLSETERGIGGFGHSGIN